MKYLCKKCRKNCTVECDITELPETCLYQDRVPVWQRHELTLYTCSVCDDSDPCIVTSNHGKVKPKNCPYNCGKNTPIWEEKK